MRRVKCADMRSTKGKGEAAEIQNINSQSGNKESERDERGWLPVINTNGARLEQIDADMVRAQERARRCCENATRETGRFVRVPTARCMRRKAQTTRDGAVGDERGRSTAVTASGTARRGARSLGLTVRRRSSWMMGEEADAAEQIRRSLE